MTDNGDLYNQVVPPLPPRYRFRDLILGEHAVSHEEYAGRRASRRRVVTNKEKIRYQDEINAAKRVRVEFFTNEKSFKQRLQLYFIKNQRSSLRIRIFNLFIKLLSCILYIVRVCLDTPGNQVTCAGLACVTNTTLTSFTTEPPEVPTADGVIWTHIIWVSRAPWLWGVQVSVAIISLTETLLLTYLGYRGNILQQILSPTFILEVINTVPFIVTIFVVQSRDVFIPVFLNCWLSKIALENMLNDLHRAMQRSQSALAQQLLILSATLACLIFISVCGIQHLQRGGPRQFSLFDSLWFVIVTFSTVGYGDVYPDIWPSKLYMMLLIATAFIVLPTQFEQLAFTWMERQKQGGNYSSHRAQNEKHVVVVATLLHADTMMDFLNEFYAHPKLQDYYVVLLSPSELNPTMKMLLQIPIWAARVIYIQGSALKDTDLSRCRVQDAEATFLIAARSYSDRTAADQHTILRSWAVKDFAPHCPQYVQIFRPENKIHVKFAEHVVCEDEFKYALLANNCLCPAISTLVTLLLHTSRGAEGQTSGEEWMRQYGKCSGNEIYHIRLGASQFFGEYRGQSFTYASFHAHRKYGVVLVGIQQDLPGSTIQLNPGPRHMMKDTDTCYYMSITKEENSAFILAHPNDDRDAAKTNNGTSGARSPTSGSYSKVASMIASVGAVGLMAVKGDDRQYETVKTSDDQQQQTTEQEAEGETCGSVALELHHTPQEAAKVTSPTPDTTSPGGGVTPGESSVLLELPPGLTKANLAKRPSIAPVPARLDAAMLTLELDSGSESDQGSVDGYDDGSGTTEYVRGFPHVTPYIGTSPTLCHLLRRKRELCCLRLLQPCSHCHYRTAREYNWRSRAIILAADYASKGLYNFIVPLRSHCRPKHTLNPIVLLLEREPDKTFLETISYFPLVYYMTGTMESLDDLLKAGINLADNIVIVNKESSNANLEDTLSDCNTIVAVQMIFRLFPSANIITELTQANNMRFMQFRAKDHYALSLSKLEKKEKERGSHLYYMFRIPFAGGNVFSASMLDTLLYQAFVKDYLITFVRLLLGVDQAVGSGHLACMKITDADLWIRTYGRLYQKLCSTTCEVPIGIYRTQTSVPSPSESSSNNSKYNNSKSWSAKTKSVLRKLSTSGMRSACTSRTSVYTNKSSGSFSLLDDADAQSAALPVERQEIIQNVRSRMKTFDMPVTDYGHGSEKRHSLSYVVINPSYDLKLQKDDIIYLIKPSSLSPKPSPLVDERHVPTRTEASPGSSGPDTGIPGPPKTPLSGRASGDLYEGLPQTPTLVIDRAISNEDEKQTVVEMGVSGTVV